MTALPRKNRLPKKDFEKVYTKGVNLGTPLLGLKFLKRTNQTQIRAGFIVGLSVSKKAVQRNRLKRQLRSLIRQILPDLKAGYDLIVIARTSALGADFGALNKEVRELLKKAQLIVKSEIRNTKS
jgi:ribonuclease P protein component